MILTIVYRSEAQARLPYTALADICLRSAENNQRLGITGFLIEFEGIFLQVLEGMPDRVDELFAQICQDPRHHDVQRLIRERGNAQPNFGFWAMNFGPLDNPAFRQAVFGGPVDVQAFIRRSKHPEFALDILARAYTHACIVAEADPTVRDIVYGNLPSFDHLSTPSSDQA